MKRKYHIHVQNSTIGRDKRWRFIMKFPKGGVVMESKWYKCEKHCRKLGEEVYQCLKHGWDK